MDRCCPVGRVRGRGTRRTRRRRSPTGSRCRARRSSGRPGTRRRAPGGPRRRSRWRTGLAVRLAVAFAVSRTVAACAGMAGLADSVTPSQVTATGAVQVPGATPVAFAENDPPVGPWHDATRRPAAGCAGGRAATAPAPAGSAVVTASAERRYGPSSAGRRSWTSSISSRPGPVPWRSPSSTG